MADFPHCKCSSPVLPPSAHSLRFAPFGWASHGCFAILSQLRRLRPSACISRDQRRCEGPVAVIRDAQFDAVFPRSGDLDDRQDVQSPLVGKAGGQCCIILKTMASKRASKVRIKIPRRELAAFCHQYQVQSLALFGSVLRTDFRRESDVDVLVSFQPSARIGFITLSRMQRELSDIFKRPVDLVPMDGLKLVIRDSVLSNMEIVYAA